ncbi:glycosyl transferase [Actinomadura rubrobrunea]|uniref:Glycosyl transferase n=1 Tax=Actinomadura rubrobrunea TaxID=115335 RepID=A0A9W6UYN3_9ACTN|nr:glycosyltransferase [Actinomadura rubrobrunea]GLW67398.1 glycosyl transferase [Actinomadura rubrobrunea]
MRCTVVVITRDRRASLLHTLGRLADLPERPPVIVVDNASRDGTAEAVAVLHPEATLLRPRANLGAVARNVAVDHVRTPYVAFCDDDTWWDPGALTRAVALLDAHPRLAVVTGRILVEPDGREDPIVRELRESPLPRPPGLPGPALGSFLAGASVLRVDAFREAGGFSPRLWLGGEEELLSADLLSRGLHLCYAEDVVVHHAPSRLRDPHLRRRHGIRNTLWCTWLRRPLLSALRRTRALLIELPRDRVTALALAEAAAGLPWVVRERRPVPPEVETRLRALDEPQRRSRARKYVS